MMRSPGNWALAVRKPDGEIAEVNRPIESLMVRHWVWRLPVIRGVIALGESLAIGFRALAISANYAAQEEGDDGEVATELSRFQLFMAFGLAIGFALLLFKVGAGAADELAADRAHGTIRARRGRDQGRRLRALPRAHLPAPRPEARLPVPRRRAQGDQRVRGRGGAGPGPGSALQPHSSPLRNRLPALGDGDRDLRVRVRRSARPGTG